MKMTTAVASAITKPPRRSVRSLSVQEKVHAIDRVHEGESKASVARDIGVPESTLRGWCKGEEKLRGIVARSNPGNSSGVDSSGSVDDSFEKSAKFNHVDGIVAAAAAAAAAAVVPVTTTAMTTTMSSVSTAVVTTTTTATAANHKRDYFAGLDDGPVAKKFPKLDVDPGNDVTVTETAATQRQNLDSPINFSKNGENTDLTSGLRTAYSPANFHKKETDVGLGSGVRNPGLPALAAIASAISNKSQLLYNAYANGLLKDMVPKQDQANKPLDYSIKVPPRLPRPDVNDALMFWLQSQRDQGTLPMSPLEARTADSSSWFWKLYKNYGVLPQSTQTNQKSNSSNGHTVAMSDEEDEPPATAADAVRHGEKFLRWLECCSDPSVTALQILQFRYLLNNVKECAERRRQVRTRTRSRRK